MRDTMPGRRAFLRASAALIGLAPRHVPADEPSGKIGDFKISLGEWSIHKALLNKEIGRREFGGEITNLDFPRIARERFGVEGVEFVNQFFHDKGRDEKYLKSLKRMADAAGVACVLIRIDGEGDLSVDDPDERQEALDGHKKWIDAAAILGCPAVRVIAGKHFKAASLWPVDECCGKLADYGARHKIKVLCENQPGPSSHPEVMLALLKAVDKPNFGVLIDCGHFPHRAGKFTIDVYDAIAQLMPFAGGLAAQTHAFDAEGRETRLDYARILKIATDAGYHGFVGIQYEGDDMNEPLGIRRTRRLLESLRGSTYSPRE